MNQQRFLPWLFWGLAALYYAYENFLQISLGVISDDIMRDFAITAQGMGVFTSVYFACYSCMQIPVGLLLDHFGTKKPLVIAVVVCAASTLLFAYTQQLWVAHLARGLIGGASAFAALSCLSMAYTHFPAHRFAMLTGLTLTVGMLGEMMAEAPLAYMVNHANWRIVMLFMGLLGLFVVILLHCILPRDDDKQTTAHNQVISNIVIELKAIVQQPKSWLISLYGMLMFTPFLMLLQGSGIGYLQSALALSKTQASHMLTMTLVGFAIGGPTLGALSDQYRKRKPVLATSSITLFISTLILILWLPQSPWLCALLFGCIGFACSGFLPGFSVMKEISSPLTQATALGFMNTLNMVGPIIAAPILGGILDALWGGQLSAQNTPIYDVHAYKIALSMLPAMAALACLLLLKIPETGARNIHSD